MDERPHSRFVTNLAVSSIGLCFLMAVMDISTLSTMNTMANSVEGRLAEQLMPSLTISPTETIIDLLLYLAGIAASFMMFRRSNVGRLAYMAILSAATMWSVVSSITAYLSVADYLRAFGLGGSLSMLVFGSILGIVINLAILWKLTRPDIVREFQ